MTQIAPHEETMATIKLPHAAEPSARPGQNPGTAADLFCPWDENLREAGLATRPSWMFAYGIPALAIGMLAVSGIVTAIDASHRGLTLPAAGLLLLAMLPWLRWLIAGDDGPTWGFAVAALAPVSLLGASHWFIDAIGPASEAAALLLAFPCLLLVILGVIFAPPRLAVGMAVAAWLAYTGPLIAALVAGRHVGGTLIIIWHMGFALTVVAAYAIRLSNETNRALADAQAALAQQAITEERRRVARDVHDVVAHTLAVTMLHITAARMAVRRGEPEEAETALEEAERQGRASLADIRRVIRLLRADDVSALDAAQPGLRDIDALIAGYRAAGLPIELTRSLNGHHASDVAELALYRVLQEALTNAARHGNGPATVMLGAQDGELSLAVSNPLQRGLARGSAGSGLAGMRERIAAAGGLLETGARDGRWIVRATVPVVNEGTG